MAKKKHRHPTASSRFRMTVTEPQNVAGTPVLEDGGDYYICCHGYGQSCGSAGLEGVWAKVYAARLPDDSPYLNDPFAPDPAATPGQTDGNAFNFVGSQHSATGFGCLIKLAADPAVTTRQFLYVWGQKASNHSYGDPDSVILSFSAVDHTHCNDTQA